MPPLVFPLVIDSVQELEDVFNKINKVKHWTACITSGDSMLPLIHSRRVVTLQDYENDEIKAGDVVSFNVDGRQIIKKVECIVPDIGRNDSLGHTYYLIGLNHAVSKDYKYFVPLGDDPKTHFKKVILYPYCGVSDKVIQQITQQ